VPVSFTLILNFVFMFIVIYKLLFSVECGVLRLSCMLTLGILQLELGYIISDAPRFVSKSSLCGHSCVDRIAGLPNRQLNWNCEMCLR
jgi:hypothetical protein